MQLIVISLIVSFVLTVSYIDRYSRCLNALAKENAKNSYINYMFMFFAIIACLRNVAVGPDTYAYYTTFNRVSEQTFGTVFKQFIEYYKYGIGKDEGYALLQWSFIQIFPSFRLFISAVAILFYSGAAYITKSNTRSVEQAFFSIILFITLFQIYAFSALRQDIALGAVMWSYYYIRNRRLVPFLIIVLAVSTIHKSVLIFIPYFWIANLRNVKTLAVLSSILIPVLFFYANTFTTLLVDFSNSEGYSYYLENTKNAGTPTFTLLLVGCFILYIFVLKRFNAVYPKHHFYTNSIFLTLGFCPVTWVVPDFMRILLYFSIFLPTIVGNSITLINDVRLRSIVKFVFVVMVTYLFIKTIPDYEFFWNNMDLGDNYDVNKDTIGI